MRTQVFVCGGKEYKSFSAVKEAFVGGSMDEATLKAALIDAVNKLLDPVRKHFSENAEAKALLEQMIEWKKADLKPPSGLKRLVAVDDAAKGPAWAVVAPPANDNVNLGELCSVLRELRAAPEGQHLVLWLPDWTSFVLNKCGGDKKVIEACYSMLVEALAAVAPDTMARVTVMSQSEAILRDPSNYWISVINVGRFFQLQRVREVDETNEYAGQVIAALMHVGDVLAMAPASLACTAGSSLEAANKLAVAYIEETGVTEIAKPTVVSVEAVDSLLKPKHMMEGPANLDDDIFLLDNTMDVGRKMKRAFCEPGNVEHCPPIILTDACVFLMGGALTVARKEENGGDKSYSSLDELRADFKSGALHPGDLKPFVTKAVDAFLQSVRDRCKSEDKAKKAEADVKAYLKKVAAASKKKK
jgi:tyrosyl-tRNA synthetase